MLCPTHSLSHLSLAAVSLTLVLTATGCVKRERNQSVAIKQPTNDQLSIAPITDNQQSSPRININTAPPSELESLPGIGKALAARIIEHREKYGPFRRVEHLIIVRGISDNRFRALRELITVE